MLSAAYIYKCSLGQDYPAKGKSPNVIPLGGDALSAVLVIGIWSYNVKRGDI